MGEWVGTNYSNGRGERSQADTLRVFIREAWSRLPEAATSS